MESGSAGEGYGEQVAAELARLRDTLDDLRRRPIPPDIDTLRHIFTASLSEASAPPPNLLVTAIRRLDRLDARLESIEAALGASAALPRAASSARGRGPAPAAPAMLPASQGADPEAIADAVARRLAGMVTSRPETVPATSGATMDDLVRALRPLVPDAARHVLRRAGREPSPQAVEVLQQTALSAIEEAGRSASQPTGSASDPWAPHPRPLGPAPQAQALSPAPSPQPPAPPPIDVDELAASIATQVTAAITAQLPPPTLTREPQAREPAPPPPSSPPLDPKVVADAVVSRLGEQPPPQAVVSAMAMAPLLSAVGNVEAAVARIVEPDAQVVGAIDRLEAGVEALARALEDDRSLQADEVRRGFAELHELLRSGPLNALDDEADWATAEVDPAALDEGGVEAAEDEEDEGVTPAAGAQGLDRLAVAVAGVQRRLDRLSRQLEPLGGADLPTHVPELAIQGQRLERSINHILTALAALAEHLHEQSSTWRGRFDELGLLLSGGVRAETGGQPAGHPHDLGDLHARIDELASGLAADRQRFQRLGGTIDGLAELLGQVSSRLERLPRSVEAGADPVAEDGDPPAAAADPPPPPGAVAGAPAVGWYDGEPPAPPPPPPPSAGVGGASPWDVPDDEPWMPDDPWGTGAGAEAPTPAGTGRTWDEGEEGDGGDGLGDALAGGALAGEDQAAAPAAAARPPGPPDARSHEVADETDDRPDAVTASSSRDPATDGGRPDPRSSDGEGEDDQRRRPSRNRRGNRRRNRRG